MVWDTLIVGGEQGAFRAGFTVGSFAVAAIAAVAGLWLIFGDGYTFLLGKEGERATREVLARASKKGLIYGSVDNVELEGRDIDHVVVAPRGVLSIETKYWKTVRVKDVDRWIAQAAKNAHATKLILLSAAIQVRRDVGALVVVWGDAVGLEEACGDRFGASVIRGQDLADWLAKRAGGELPVQQGIELVRKLEEFATQHALS